MNQLMVASIIVFVIVGADLKGGEESGEEVESSVNINVFDKMLGNESRFSNPKYIMQLPSGYLIGCQNWRINKEKRVVTFHRCCVVKVNKGEDTVSPFVICSESGVASLALTGRGDSPISESILAIRFQDGSSFEFPSKSLDNSNRK